MTWRTIAELTNRINSARALGTWNSNMLWLVDGQIVTFALAPDSQPRLSPCPIDGDWPHIKISQWGENARLFSGDSCWEGDLETLVGTNVDLQEWRLLSTAGVDSFLSKDRCVQWWHQGKLKGEVELPAIPQDCSVQDGCTTIWAGVNRIVWDGSTVLEQERCAKGAVELLSGHGIVEVGNAETRVAGKRALPPIGASGATLSLHDPVVVAVGAETTEFLNLTTGAKFSLDGMSMEDELQASADWILANIQGEDLDSQQALLVARKATFPSKADLHECHEWPLKTWIRLIEARLPGWQLSFELEDDSQESSITVTARGEFFPISPALLEAELKLMASMRMPDNPPDVEIWNVSGATIEANVG